jgi:hypothetical protein
VAHGGRGKPPWAMAVAGATVTYRRRPRRLGTVALRPSWLMVVRVSLFSKNRNFFINSDGDKLYTKLVAFDEIYNFVLQTFFHLKSSWGSKNWYIIQMQIPKTKIWKIYQFFRPKMTSNEKNLNYKIVDLVESYKFRIKFISIRVDKKSYDFLKTDWP